MIKASELKPGQTVQVEYGDYGNFVKFQIDEVHVFEKMTLVRCHSGDMQTDLSWQNEELVEVIS